MKDRGSSWLLLGILWLVVVVTSLYARPLLPVDETRYATVAWEMWARGDFLVPHLDYIAYYKKPPLFYWLAGVGFATLGETETAARLPAVLATLLRVATFPFPSRRNR